MVKEIVFHLGNRKTGSTSIQDALAQNAVYSPDKTIFYPARANNLSLAKTLGAHSDTSKRHDRFQNLAKRLQDSDADIAVISAEFFEVVDPVILRDTIDRYLPQYRDNIRLLAYVRPHAERVLSNFAEQTKLGQFFGPLERFNRHLAEQKTLFYTPKFKAWRQVFGSAFELRPFIRAKLLKGDVVHDFIDYVLQGAPYTLEAQITSNPSLSVEYLSMIREFQSNLKKNKTAQHLTIPLGKYLGRQLASQPVKTHHKLRLHKRVAKHILEIYESDAAALDAEFFPLERPMEAALITSLNKAIDKPISLVPADNMTDDHVRMVSVWAMLTHVMSEGLVNEVCANLNKNTLKSLQQKALGSSQNQPHVQAGSPLSFALSHKKATNL